MTYVNLAFVWACIIDINDINTNSMQLYRFINNSNQVNMFQELIPPIFRSTRPCVYGLWYNASTMLTAGYRLPHVRDQRIERYGQRSERLRTTLYSFTLTTCSNITYKRRPRSKYLINCLQFSCLKK